MINYPNNESQYLITLLSCAIKGEKAPLPQYDVNHEKLLMLAKEQQVYNTVLPVLEQLHILSDDELSKWKDYNFTEIKKMLTVNSERSAVCADLDKNAIDYMFLKGLEIRNYYPKTIMRQMSDNDILYREKDRSKLVSVMKKHGFYIISAAGISDDFEKPPYCTFEFHRTLFSQNEDFHPDFNPWEHAVREENSCRYVISREDNYIYALCHLYKHYHCVDGCGVRFLCDLYLLLHSGDKLDYEYINKTLDNFGVGDFNKTAVGLAHALFDGAQSDDKQQALLDFMLSGSVYGSGRDTISEDFEKYGNSKVKYLFKRTFPPFKMMRGNYKILEKLPFLLPFMYIYRLFEKSKHRKAKLKQEMDFLKKH